jgi:hypothetical protein
VEYVSALTTSNTRLGFNERLIMSTPILAARQENDEYIDEQVEVTLRTGIGSLHSMNDAACGLLDLQVVHSVAIVAGYLCSYVMIYDLKDSCHNLSKFPSCEHFQPLKRILNFCPPISLFGNNSISEQNK